MLVDLHTHSSGISKCCRIPIEQVVEEAKNVGIDGIVLTKQVSEGQSLTSGFSTPEMFTLAQDLTKMQIEAKVSEADVVKIKEGQEAT